METDKEKPELMPMHYGKKKEKLEDKKAEIEREVAYYLKRRKSNRTEIMFRAAFLALFIYLDISFITGRILVFGHPVVSLLFGVLFFPLFVIPMSVILYRIVKIYIVEEKMRKECMRQIEDVEDEINNLTFKMMLKSADEEEDLKF